MEQLDPIPRERAIVPLWQYEQWATVFAAQMALPLLPWVLLQEALCQS